MTDDKGLGAIPIHLNAEQAHILAAHEQLKNALNAIEYPKSGRWEDRDTAILVLEALAEYVAAFTDGEPLTFELSTIILSSTVRFSVFSVVVVPLTVRSPPTTTSPVVVTLAKDTLAFVATS